MEAVTNRSDVERGARMWATSVACTPETQQEDNYIQNLLPDHEVVRVTFGCWDIFAAPGDDYTVAQLRVERGVRQLGSSKSTWSLISRTISNYRYRTDSIDFHKMSSGSVEKLLAKGRKHIVPLSPTELCNQSIMCFRAGIEDKTAHLDSAVRGAADEFCEGASVGRAVLDYLTSDSPRAAAALAEMSSNVQTTVAAYAAALRDFETGPTHAVNCAFIFSRGRDYWEIPITVLSHAYIASSAYRVSSGGPADPTIKDMSAMPQKIRDALSALSITDINQCVPGVGMRVSKEAAYVFYK